jgi:hypothetical protein
MEHKQYCAPIEVVPVIKLQLSVLRLEYLLSDHSSPVPRNGGWITAVPGSDKRCPPIVGAHTVSCSDGSRPHCWSTRVVPVL